ncbi:MAG: branched-chain amino acid ABC transporter permease [Treponema sp.]|nr:MAG: branched-chain amino acid ABC transporter permease [Treponema sp.]
MQTLILILKISSPLLFATLAALVTEYAGVLAIFIEGIINLSAFLFVTFTILTGNLLLGMILSNITSILFIFILAVFTHKTKANPFLVGLSINLFSAGIIMFLKILLFKNNTVISFNNFSSTTNIQPFNSIIPTLIACAFATIIFIFTQYSYQGIKLKYSGTNPETFLVRGNNPAKYKIVSWIIGTFLASSAGITMALNLAAYSPNISSGTGWIALVAIFLGYKNALLCIPAVIIFSAAQYYTNILQTASIIPKSIILALPYIFALFIFTLTQILQNKASKKN